MFNLIVYLKLAASGTKKYLKLRGVVVLELHARFLWCRYPAPSTYLLKAAPMTYSEFHKLRYQYIYHTLDPLKKSVEVEKEVEKSLIDYLSKWFTVYSQVRSDCKKYRCDILMYHKERYEDQRPIIIEIKKESVKQGSSLGDWCNQANEYSEAKFHSKHPLVFIFPQISGIYFEEGCHVSPYSVVDEDHHNINSFLYGGFRIGELRKMKYNEQPVFALVINNKTLWCSSKPWVLNHKIYQNGH